MAMTLDSPTAQALPDFEELQRRAVERAAARAGGDHLRDGHIVCHGLVRIYKSEGITGGSKVGGSGFEVVALQGLDLVVDRGELIAVVGASGSGKSTLLNILSGLDVPTAGLARVGGYDLLTLSARRRLRYRRTMVGFVWQQTGRNLLPYLTARENVELPMQLAGRFAGGAARKRALDLLEMTGVAYCARRRPEQMSGGEQQRVAVAVAVANDPEVLFADEPTGELDEATGADVFAALRTINAELGVTIMVVTHDAAVSGQVARTVAIRDGRTAAEVRRTTRVGADGQEELVTQEYAVLDRAGRLQLPAAFVEQLQMRDRVRLDLEPDHVQVRPGHDDAEGNGR
jgi:putative ABC transport system ATP-binding protein